jgi:ubiquinone biosynthesis monooxygenase Coq7
MLLPSSDPSLTIKRILKVNHAGETGAIRIYAAQLAIARRAFPEVVDELDEMRRDEVEHCRLFREAMPARQARPCRVMSLWSLGGYVLGFVTALLGPRMVWLCTEAVEATVHRHLEDQLAFLKTRDPGLHALIASIQEQEASHLASAQTHQAGRRRSRLAGAAYWSIAATTETLIWLSTWGDSGWMGPEMARNR